MNILALILALSDSIATVDGVVIASDSSCPSAAAVHDALRALPHPGLLAVAAAVKTDEVLTVELTTSHRGGHALRRLPLDEDCGKRAETVALVIVSWADAGTAEPPPLVVTDLISPFQRPAAPPASAWEAGAGVLSVSDSFGASPGLRLEVTRAPRQDGFGWRLAAMLAGSRQVREEGGVSHYTRNGLAFTPMAAVTEGRLRGEADVGAVLGLTHASGDRFASNRSESAALPGATMGARLGVRVSWVTLWVETRGVQWLRNQSLVVEREGPQVEVVWGAGKRTALPDLEVHVAAGVSALLPARER
jgi:hypothetical protein